MNNTRTLAERIAALVVAIQNCERSGNAEWLARHTETLAKLARDYLPSGSGFDNGCRIHVGASSAHRLVISAAYHHMDEHGYYSGWSHHEVIANATFGGPDIRITGRDRDGIKDYIAEVFHAALTQPIAE